MTIIKPVAKENFTRFLMLLFAIVLIGSLTYIFEYNSLVDTRFELKRLKEEVVKAETLNADLKNALYQVVNPVLLEKEAAAADLILERNPEYLTRNTWLSDSSR